MAKQKKTQDEALYALYVGEKYAYYQATWAKQPAGRLFAAWNWAAFFLSAPWLVYRKLYREAALYFVVILLLSFLPVELFTYDLLVCAVSVAVGAFGNALYCKRVRQQVVLAQQMAGDESHYTAAEYLTPRGGVNKVGAVLAGVLMLLLLFVLPALLMQLLYQA